MVQLADLELLFEKCNAGGYEVSDGRALVMYCCLLNDILAWRDFVINVKKAESYAVDYLLSCTEEGWIEAILTAECGDSITHDKFVIISEQRVSEFASTLSKYKGKQ